MNYLFNSKEYMKDFKQILEEVKKVVFSEDKVKETVDAVENTEVTKEAEQTFEAVTLSDGTLINIEPSVEAGSAVTIEDPELGFVPVPDGSYELEDKRIIVVAGGVIESVEEVAEEVEEEMETESTEEPTLTEKEVRKIIESVETHFNSVVESLKDEVAKLKEVGQERAEAFVSAIEKIGEEPKEESVNKQKGFNFRKKTDKGIEALINFKTKK